MKYDIRKTSFNLLDLVEESDLIEIYDKKFKETRLIRAGKHTVKLLRYRISKNEVELLRIMTHEEFEDKSYKTKGG